MKRLTIHDATDVPEHALPSNQGFRVFDGGKVVVFMHWSPEEEAGSANYADVLAALPDRLAEQGYEDEIDAVLGEVVGRYGARP